MFERIAEKWREWTNTLRRPAQFDSPDYIFKPVDAVALQEKLDVERRARADGNSNSPRSTDNIESATELDIYSEVNAPQNKYADEYNDLIQVHKEKIDGCNQDLNLDKIENEEKKQLDEILQEGKKMQGDLQKVTHQLKSSANELLEYRKKHHLMDRGPDTRDFYAMLTIVVIAFVLEVAVTLFLTRESGPLPTVAVIVVLYCVLNFWMPYFLARFVKYSFYKTIDAFHGFKKAFGVLFGLLLLIGLLVLNLGMGHYRSAGLTFGITEATTIAGILEDFARQQELITAAWENFRTDPFGIDEILSWLLVAMGYFLSFVALYEGTTWDDRYPLYGKLAKKYHKAHDLYQDSIDQFIDDINELRDAAINSVAHREQLFRDALKKIPDIANDSKRLYEKYLHANEQLSTIYKRSIALYRQENRQHRMDRAPAYFDEPIPELEAPEVEKYEPERIDEKLDKEAALKKIDDMAQNIHNRIDEMTRSIPPANEVVNFDPLGI